MLTLILIGITVIISYSCFNNRYLFQQLAFIPYLIKRENEWYRFISHGFVHADTLHLLVNMITFYSFGSYMEQVFIYFGFSKYIFLLLYFGGMVVASVGDYITKKDNAYYVSVGASGAVSAVLFSAIFFNPWDKILLFMVIPIPGILFGVLYLVYCQYMAKQSVDNINHNAHFYGAVFGFLFPLMMEPSLFYHFLSRL